uniref:hypothetical protein n=1 Tax=Salmonella sp. s51228 TaxID=3159652 RepID=UPI00397FE615
VVPTLNIIIHGTNLFPGEQFERTLNEGAHYTHDYRLNVKLALDYNCSKSSAEEILRGQSQAEEIGIMRQLVDGISVITILINFEEHFTKGMDNFINQLRRVYGLI